jgi:hypothetical protein
VKKYLPGLQAWNRPSVGGVEEGDDEKGSKQTYEQGAAGSTYTGGGMEMPVNRRLSCVRVFVFAGSRVQGSEQQAGGCYWEELSGECWCQCCVAVSSVGPAGAGITSTSIDSGTVEHLND